MNPSFGDHEGMSRFATGPARSGKPAATAALTGVVLTAALAWGAAGAPAQEVFARGDANRDATIDVSDAVYLLLGLFRSPAGLPCDDAADANDDGQLDVSDAVFTLRFLFTAGAVPPPPYPSCGEDPTPDGLGCAEMGAVEPVLPDGYSRYLQENPAVARSAFDRLDGTSRCLLASFLQELDATGAIQLEPPAAMGALPAGASSVAVTAAEARRIVAAKTAHAFWIDHEGIVPWRLEEYAEEELRGLFDPVLLLDSGRFLSVVDHSPSEVFRYASDKDLLRADRLATVSAVLDDLRADFYHGSPSYGDPATAYTLRDALTVYSDRGFLLARIARIGCHSMARITVGVLRSLNIPGTVVTSGWFLPGHATGVWPAIERVMPHGDDIYRGDLRAIPSAELLPGFSFYDDPGHQLVCGSDRPCLSLRHRALGAIAHPADWVRSRCCDPARYGYASCEDYLVADYGAWLTAEEIAAAAVKLEAACPP